MVELTRRRYPERQDCWHIYFAHVHVDANGQLAIAFHNARLIYVNVEGDWSKFDASTSALMLRNSSGDVR